VLFNGAGYVHAGTILDCDEAVWDFSFDLNVRAMYRIIRATLPAMLMHGGGSIINMASVASSLKGAPYRFVAIEDRAGVHVAGAVEEHLQRRNVIDERLDRERVGDVEVARADAFDARQLGQCGIVDVGRDDRRAVAREGLRGGASDALAGGRDECGLVLQSHAIESLSFTSTSPSRAAATA
jgi:hypothetical protein